MLKRRKCDQCNITFKRGVRMDLIVNKVTIREGEPQWSTSDDIEFFAYFCSPGCLMGYLIDNYYIPEGGKYEDLKEVKEPGLSEVMPTPASGD